MARTTVSSFTENITQLDDIVMSSVQLGLSEQTDTANSMLLKEKGDRQTSSQLLTAQINALISTLIPNVTRINKAKENKTGRATCICVFKRQSY